MRSRSLLAMNTSPPKIFISATSGDLRSIRQIVKEALLTIGCHPVEQTNFAPDWRTVEGMLRGKIEDCQALMHIAGMRYGAEPNVASLPPGTSRRSYTQMEYDLGCQLQSERGDTGFRVYVFVCPESFPYDIPADADGQPSPPDPEEKARLQREHRAALLCGRRIYYEPTNPDDLRTRILAIQEQVLALHLEQVEVKAEVRSSRKSILIVLAVVLGVLALVKSDVWKVKRAIAKVAAGQKHDPPAIKATLIEATERGLAKDLAAVDEEPNSDERRRLRDAAQAAHKLRLSLIDDHVAEYERLATATDTTVEMREVIRILSEPKEGVDAALRYIESQRTRLIQEEERIDAAHLEQKRARLQPLLKAASLQATQGHTAIARSSYQDLLKRDPQWSQALEGLSRVIADQRLHFWYWESNESFAAALADAQLAIADAESLPSDGTDHPTARNLVLANALMWYGDVLSKRKKGDDESQALQYHSRSLDLIEKLQKADPSYLPAEWSLSLSLERIGDLLVKRGQPGDLEKAFDYQTRSFQKRENELKRSPDSDAAKRDLSISYEKIGDILAKQGQPGNIVAALDHYNREREILEELLKASPDSAQAARDVSVSLEKLGDLLVLRGQPGDADTALKHYTRYLEIGEKLLQANPDSAQVARDMWVSCWKLAQFAEATGKGDAKALWQRAYDIVNGMAQKGMFLSTDDRERLEMLREKVKQPPTAGGGHTPPPRADRSSHGS